MSNVFSNHALSTCSSTFMPVAAFMVFAMPDTGLVGGFSPRGSVGVIYPLNLTVLIQRVIESMFLAAYLPGFAQDEMPVLIVYDVYGELDRAVFAALALRHEGAARCRLLSGQGRAFA